MKIKVEFRKTDLTEAVCQSCNGFYGEQSHIVFVIQQAGRKKTVKRVAVLCNHCYNYLKSLNVKTVKQFDSHFRMAKQGVRPPKRKESGEKLQENT